ncbi:MAG: bifunctional diaminohydroxyphosphoribosylaminopyrimidine deaminase/5-amino-6-(5-phosphoribosylamino)uracil reductase RibD [Ignavibacteria bacterium]|nr:bifunctional diaminohydroxyphosphoribosylaminopyrimidine deaminase/5-amino-6-(5-phosphoribosylamino)uracil reductase RibD [Ignavibacteria bacterium]
MRQDEFYIKLTLELAAKGKGRVSPNPLVGSVLVKNGKIIGAGFHEFYGGPHAEINAMRNAIEEVAGSTLYVNLEPCSHHGKTPPCVDAIIEKGITKVIIGTLDNNPLVSGQGVKKLVQHGIEVRVGVLEKECMELNRFFFKYIQKKTPYVTLKVAQTLDGKIADINSQSEWITSQASRTEVHRMRAEYDAVIIGVNTAIVDNPSLTVRHIEGRNPLRVILDSRLRLPFQTDLLEANPEKNTCIVTLQKNKTKVRKIARYQKMGADVIFVPPDENGHVSVKHALKALGKKGILSVMVEGGSAVFSTFLKEKVVDEVSVFINPRILGNGIPAFANVNVDSIKNAHKWRIRSTERFSDDILLNLRKAE